MQDTLGYSAVANGWLMVITAIGLTIGALASSKLSIKLTVEQLLGIGLCFVVLGSIMMLVLAYLYGINVYVVVGPMMIYIIGTGMIYPNCIAGAMNLHHKMSGVTGSLFSSLQMLSAGITIILIANFNALNQKPLSVLMTATSIVAVMSYLLFIRKKS